MSAIELRAATGSGASEARDAVVVCLACRVDFDGQPDADHAAYFAGVHNDLHHGARPVAFTAPVEGPPFGGDAA